MADLQRVNGNLISWGSLTLKLGNELWSGVTEVTFSQKVEKTKGYGSGPHQGPRGRSKGKYTCEPVKLKMFLDSERELRMKLKALATDGRSYGTVTFDGELFFAEANLPAHHAIFYGLQWTSESVTASEGSEGIMSEIELDCMFMQRDGGTLFDSSAGFPSAG